MNGSGFSKTAGISVLCALGFVIGFSGLLQARELDLPKDDSEQTAFLEKGLKATPAREYWEQAFGQVSMFKKSKAFVDQEDMRTVKKLAIISFDSGLYAEKKAGIGGKGSLLGLATMPFTEKNQREGIQPQDLIQFNNLVFDEFRNRLIAQGFEVPAPEAVAANEAYVRVEGEQKDASLNSAWSLSNGIKATASAKDLKSIPALSFIKPGAVALKGKVTERAAALQELAKALGVDAVVIVSNNLYMKIGGLKGKYDLWFANNDKGPDGITIDIFSAAAPKLIWSAALSDPLVVPTSAAQEGAGYMIGAVKYEFGDKAMPDYVSAYEVMADLFAKKIKADAAP